MQAMGSDRLRALLWDMAADDRRLLECRIVDGWRYADIAVHLGVPRHVLAVTYLTFLALFATLMGGVTGLDCSFFGRDVRSFASPCGPSGLCSTLTQICANLPRSILGDITASKPSLKISCTIASPAARVGASAVPTTVTPLTKVGIGPLKDPPSAYWINVPGELTTHASVARSARAKSPANVWHSKSGPAYHTLTICGGSFDRCKPDRKSTRLNSSHRCISYAVFCLKK